MPVKKQDLKSIKTMMREISEPYADAKPTEVTDVYWIIADRMQGEYPKFTEKSGKWLVFVPDKDVMKYGQKSKRLQKKGSWDTVQRWPPQNLIHMLRKQTPK